MYFLLILLKVFMIFLTTLIFSRLHPVFTQTSYLVTNIQDDLARFQSIATRCRASMATTTDRRSFDHFKAIVALYKKHAFAIKNRDLIDADELYETYKECSYGLQAYITTRQLLQQTREHTQSSPP